MSQRLELDFKTGKLYDAYQRLQLRLESFDVKPLGNGAIHRCDGSLSTCPVECAALRKQFYNALLNCRRQIDPSVWEELPVHADLPSNTASAPPTVEQVRAALDCLKICKAAGVCRIIPEMLKYGGSATTTWLHRIITIIWQTGKAPDDWKRSLLVPILKKGDPSVLDNFRGTSLQSIAGKVYSLILRSHLNDWAESVLSEAQCGFRRGRGCNDALFYLKTWYEKAAKKHKSVYTCFIDPTRAYDSVDRSLAWQVLRSRGAHPKNVDLIQDLHDGTTCALQLDSHDSQTWFPVCTGFKQGDVNAPLLFNVFIDSIVRTYELAVSQLGVKWAYKIDRNLREVKNPSVEGITWILMYADDIALVTGSEETMRAAMNIVHEALRKWGLHINVLKTKPMKLKLNDEPDLGDAMMLGPAEIEIVEKFKYLGAVRS